MYVKVSFSKFLKCSLKKMAGVYHLMTIHLLAREKFSSHYCVGGVEMERELTSMERYYADVRVFYVAFVFYF